MSECEQLGGLVLSDIEVMMILMSVPEKIIEQILLETRLRYMPSEKSI